MAKTLAGTAYLAIDGRTYLLVGDFAYNASRVTRETMIGMDGIHGNSEKPRAGMIKMKCRDYGDISIAEINQMRNVTVTVEMANGKIVVGRNMWTTGDQEVEGTEATFDVVFEGPSVQEVLSV